MCVDVCVHVCVDVCMHVCVDVCVHVCVDVCVHVCVDVCVHVCVDVHLRLVDNVERKSTSQGCNDIVWWKEVHHLWPKINDHCRQEAIIHKATCCVQLK